MTKNGSFSLSFFCGDFSQVPKLYFLDSYMSWKIDLTSIINWSHVAIIC